MKIVMGMGLALALFGANAFAQDASSTATPAAEPTKMQTLKPALEAATLPENLMRLRAIYGYGWGDQGFDKDGKKVDSPVEVSAQGGAAVFEYGVTGDVSLQVLVPFSTSKELKLSEKMFNQEFDKSFTATTSMTPTALPGTVAAQIVDGVAAAVAQAQSIPLAAAKAAIEAGQIKASDLIALGGKLDFAALGASSAQLGTLVAVLKPANIEGDATITASDIAARFTTAITKYRAAALKQAEDQVKDKATTGLGDVELGVKYSVSSPAKPLIDGVPLFASVGLGIRLNTSDFEGATKDGKLPVGRGTTDYGLRLNLDYVIVDGIGIALENQTEGQILGGKTYGGEKKVDFERVGMRQVGYAKLVVEPSAWIDSLAFLSVSGKYNYNAEAATKTDGREQDAKTVEQSQSLTASLGLSGFSYSIPLQFDLDYTMPLSGKNVAVATTSLTGTLKAFYKF